MLLSAFVGTEELYVPGSARGLAYTGCRVAADSRRHVCSIGAPVLFGCLA
jgi:hypothetical protein